MSFGELSEMFDVGSCLFALGVVFSFRERSCSAFLFNKRGLRVQQKDLENLRRGRESELGAL